MINREPAAREQRSQKRANSGVQVRRAGGPRGDVGRVERLRGVRQRGGEQMSTASRQRVIVAGPQTGRDVAPGRKGGPICGVPAKAWGVRSGFMGCRCGGLGFSSAEESR